MNMTRILLFLLLLCGVAEAGVPCTVPNTFVNNTVADANQVNANFSAVTNCLLNAAAAGANSDITSLNALTSPILPSQGGSSVFVGGTSTGTANAQVVATTVPTGFLLTKGWSVIFTAGFSNITPPLIPPGTPAFQLNVNTTGLTNVFKQTPSGLQPLIGGEIVAGQLVTVVYDGTEFVLGPTGQQVGGFGPPLSIASAATVDLGTVPSHNALISGTTTITGFGSTAQASQPIYMASFSGSLTLTSNTPANTPPCSPNTTGGCLYLPGSPGNVQTAAGDVALLQYLGTPVGGMANWAVIMYQRASGAALFTGPAPCGFNHLTWGNGASSSVVTINWDTAALLNAGQATVFSGPQTGLTLNVTTGTGTSTPGGMDGHSPAAGNFIYMYAISNGSLFNVLGSTNVPPVAPILPTGYLYACYLGAIRTNSPGNVLVGTQGRGRKATYVVGGANLVPPASGLPIIAAGAVGAGCTTLAPFPVVPTHVPTLATSIKFVISNSFNNVGTVGQVAVSPNGSYGLATTAPGQNVNAINFGASESATGTFEFELESNSIYVCGTNAGMGLQAYGWSDAVNAN